VSARGSAVALAEAVENKRKEFSSDPLAAVAHSNLKIAIGAFYFYFDATTSRFALINDSAITEAAALNICTVF